MATQRPTTRRGFLGVAAGVLASGCVDAAAGVESGESVSVLAAGSLQQTFAEGVADAVTPRVAVEAHGSVAAARLAASGKRDPDLLALADTDLFGTVVDARWHAEFATNALVVAYDPDSAGGRRVRDADRWFEPVLAGEATLGRTDPHLDPLGYRTLFVLSLSADYYDRPDLRERLVAPDQVYPETGLLSRLETGAVDAAVVYRSMAVERGYDYRDLPAAVDLSDPARDDAYRRASTTLSDGTTVRGEHVAYGAVARSDDAATGAVFDALVGGDALAARGFGVPDALPTFSGDVPRRYQGDGTRAPA